MPFEDNEVVLDSNKIPINSAVKKVDNTIYFPSLYKMKNEKGELVYTDANNKPYTNEEVEEIRNQVKEHIMKYGAISVNIYSPVTYYNSETYAANCNVPIYPDHTVTIIGWDDNFKKENFINAPSTDGAYIALNSWGTTWGEQGIYYISYEDFNVEGEMRGVISVSDIEYDNIYQYDLSEMWNEVKYKYCANVFTSNQDEVLTEIMVGSIAEQECNIYINPINENLQINSLIPVANNVKLNPGYNTIKLSNEIELTKGNKFAVIVELIGNDYSGIGIEDVNKVPFAHVSANIGESLVSSDGVTWYDLYKENREAQMNLSIKAYTKSKTKELEVSEINGVGLENYGGELTFSVKTNYSEKGNPISIQILKDENDITNEFMFKGNTIQTNGAFVTIVCPNTVQCGHYTAKIKISEFEEVEKTFEVKKISENSVIIQCNDINFLNSVATSLEESIIDNSQLKIITNQNSIDAIEEINISNCNINSLVGIENFKNLKKLNISHNEITDITPLMNLENIEILNLSMNSELINLEPIKNYKKITELDLAYDGKALKNGDGINIVSSLNSLTCLDLDNAGIEDLNWISSLENLNSLKICNNTINDFSVLLNLRHLDYLNVSGTNVKDHMQVIGNLTEIKELHLAGDNLDNLNFLTNLNKLKRLNVSSNNLEDISLVGQITGLEYLSIGYNNIEDISALANIKKLLYLEATHNKIKDISPLKDLVYLGVLSLNENNIEDISYLPATLGICMIWFNDNQINREVLIYDNNEIAVELPPVMKEVNNGNSFFYKCRYEFENCRFSEDGNSIIVDPKVGNTAVLAILDSSNYLKVKFNITLKQQEGRVLTNIEIKEGIRTTYFLGEALDLSDLKLIATYDNGDKEEVTSGFTTSIENGTPLNTIGEQEITVTYGGKNTSFIINVSNSIGEKLEVDTTTLLQVQEGETVYLTNIEPKTTKANILKNIITNGEIEILKGEEKIETEDEIIGTGYVLKISKGDEKREFIFIILGDATGDGEVNFKDILKVNKHRLNKQKLVGAYLKAGDATQDQVINFKDILRINKFRLNKIKSL